MSTTAYDHHDIDCSQSPFFSVRSSTYRPLRTAILVSNVLRGRVSGFIAVGGGGRPTPCQKEGQSTWYSSPGYNLGQKVLRILHFLTHRRPTLRIWHHVTPPPVPPPLPGQCCLVRSKNVSVTRQLCFFGGGGGSILSEPGFRGKYSKIRLTRCLFLNIFVQDCRLVTGARWPSARAGARFLPSHGKIGK